MPIREALYSRAAEFRETDELESSQGVLLHSGGAHCHSIPGSFRANYGVFKYGHRLEKPDVLEGPTDAASRSLVG